MMQRMGNGTDVDHLGEAMSMLRRQLRQSFRHGGVGPHEGAHLVRVEAHAYIARPAAYRPHAELVQRPCNCAYAFISFGSTSPRLSHALNADQDAQWQH